MKEKQKMIITALAIFIAVFIASILFHKLIDYNIYPTLRSFILAVGGVAIYYKLKTHKK